MTPREQFVQDPVAFMTTNVLRCQFLDGGVKLGESRPYVMTVKELTDKPKVVNSPGGGVYHLSIDVTGCATSEKTPMYFVGYKDNDTVQATLDNRSRIMFTANMDGCSLGIGTMSGDGACLVTHANKKSAAGGLGQTNRAAALQLQASAQHEQLRGVYGGEDFHAIAPPSYMDAMGDSGVFKGTNFGVNRNGWWFFYTHRWMKMNSGIAGNYVHGGCEEATFVLGM